MTSALVVGAVAIAAAVPTGTFRTTITTQDLVAGHAGNLAGNRGTYTLRVQVGNQWTMRNTAVGHLINPPRGGTYTATGGTVVFDDLTGGSLTARVSYRSGLLRFTVLRSNRPELRVIFGAHAWRRVP